MRYRAQNREIVVTEESVYGRDGQIVVGMWAERHKYPMALFAENMTFEQFLQKIVEKFHSNTT